MEMSEARYLGGRPNYVSPTVGEDGVWASAGAHALRGVLRRQSARGVMDLLKSMDASGMAAILRETGFEVDERLVRQGRGAVYEGVKGDLQAALVQGVDGFGLRKGRAVRGMSGQGPGTAPRSQVAVTEEYPGNQQAAEMIQGVLKASGVRVAPLGEQPFSQRASLQMVAAQALKKGVLGFGFDGLPGKFSVPAPMSEVVDLHRQAAVEVATQSTRAGLAAWVSGAKVADLSEWVPDSVQRLLHGSVSKDAAEIVVSGLQSGSIARHAQEFGIHGIAGLLRAQGLDADAPTIGEQADEMGLRIKEPDRERGQYFGTVVAQDHRSSLIKINREEAIELPFAEASGVRPRVGELLRIGFKAGVLSVSSKDMGREGNSR